MARKSDTITIKKSTLIIVSVAIAFIIGILVGGSMSGFFSASNPDSDNTQNLIQVSEDDDPFLGKENAPITVIEFSDFQCPFCRKSFIEMLPQLKANYIDTGKVKFVYRDFPLDQGPRPLHPSARKAAESAECAEDQGKFWEMHDKIFEEQNKLGVGTIAFTVDDLRQWASEIGLDMNDFNQCLDSGKYADEVEKDLRDGVSYGVSGTPTFFIGNKKGFIKLVGAQPYEVFEEKISQLS